MHSGTSTITFAQSTLQVTRQFHTFIISLELHQFYELEVKCLAQLPLVSKLYCPPEDELKKTGEGGGAWRERKQANDS